MSAPPLPPSYSAVFLYDQPFSIFNGAITIDPPVHIFVIVILPMILYLLCIKVIFPAMKPHGKEAILSCDKWRKRHNFFMFFYSLASFVISFRELLVNPGESRFMTSLDLAEDWTPVLCNPPTPLMQWVNGIFILSKMVEWIDTGFIIWLKNDESRQVLAEAKKKNSINTTEGTSTDLRKTTFGDVGTDKQNQQSSSSSSSAEHEISFLHAYHHMTTMFAFIIVLNSSLGPKFGQVNMFVHIFMYLHYLRPLPKAVVPLITASQILQFFFLMFAWNAARDHCPDFKQFAAEHPREFYTPFLFTPVYLVFFVKYFVQRFILGRGRGGNTQNKKE